MRYVLVILVALPLFSWGQGNLVPNGDFEEVVHCPDMAFGNLMVYCIPYWATPTIGSPDYYSDCGVEIFNTSLASTGPQQAHSGQAFIGMFCFAPGQPEGREYAQAELTQPIYPGVRYKVSFYASLADMSLWAVSSLGAHLSVNAIHHDEYWLLDVVPQILNPVGNIITDTANWVLVTDTFTSRTGGGEKFITIGNFNTAATSDTLLYNPNGAHNYNFAYYYIDDVSVIALDSIPNGVEEAESLAFKVWPNPAQNHITITAPSALTAASVSIYNISGQRLVSGAYDAQLDISNLPNGVYFIELRNQTSIARQRFVKM